MERRWQVLMVVVAGVFMAGLDLFIVNIAFPQIRVDFAGTSLGTLSWVLNAYTIVFAAFLVVAGRWSDTFGRKRSFLLGVALFTAASAACTAAPSIGFLVAARALQGFGAALLMPASLGLLLPEFPAERRHVAIGVWAAVGGVAAAAGPPLGGLLVQASWRWVFLVNVPVGLAALLAGWRVLREVRHPEPGRPDFPGAGVLTVAVAALAGAIVQGGQWGWGSARIVGLLALAALLLAVLGRRIARHPAPIVEPALLAVRAFSLATVASLLFFAAFAGMLLGCVLFLTGVWHESTLTAGLMIAPGPALAAALGAGGAPGQAPRREPRGRGRHRAVRARRRVVDRAARRRAALRDGLPAGHDRRRGRGRPDDPLADRDGRGDARAGAPRDRHRGPGHRSPARLRAGRGDPRCRRRRRTHRGRLRGRLALHARCEPARGAGARGGAPAPANAHIQSERSGAGEARNLRPHLLNNY